MNSVSFRTGLKAFDAVPRGVDVHLWSGETDHILAATDSLIDETYRARQGISECFVTEFHRGAL